MSMKFEKYILKIERYIQLFISQWATEPAGMKNPKQHSKLLYEYHEKIKIIFEYIQKFANIEESIEKQATKHKPASVNSISKGKGKSAAKKPAPANKDPEKNVISVAPPGMKPLIATPNIGQFAKSTFTK